MPVAVALTGVACVYDMRVLAGSSGDCPRWMLPSPPAAAASMIVDLLQPVLHAADPSASSIAACAFTACLQVQPLPPPLPHIPPHSPPPPACYPCPPTACARPALLLIMLASFAPAGGALHSVQHEVIVAEVVAAWSRLPTAARVLLLPVFVQVHAISARVTSAIAHHPPGARWMRTLLCGVGYGHVQGHLAQRRPHPQPPLPLLRHSPPSLTFQSRRVVGVRTPFLTALLDALSSALSRACMSRSCVTALLSSVASSPGQEARRRARRRRSYNWLPPPCVPLSSVPPLAVCVSRCSPPRLTARVALARCTSTTAC